MKRGASGSCALLAIDKPLAMSSHDVVSAVRRITGERRVGHMGTLDPLATGVLLVGVGPATRLSPYLIDHDKTYTARIEFGTATDTDDAEGDIIESSEVPDELADPFFAVSTVAALCGTFDQTPPLYSALKRDGQVAYKVARAGGALEVEPRTVTVYGAKLIGIDVNETVTWEVSLSVSKGTYIRAIARDLGRSLGTCAHLSALRRTVLGHVGISDAISLDALRDSSLADACIDPVYALGLPSLEVSDDTVAPLYDGKLLDAPAGTPGGAVALTHAGRMLSIHECEAGHLRALTVIPEGIIGVRSYDGGSRA